MSISGKSRIDELDPITTPHDTAEAWVRDPTEALGSRSRRWSLTNIIAWIKGELGTAAEKDHGTAAGEVPLNSDLGTAAQVDHGTATDEVPLNSDLGTAATEDLSTFLETADYPSDTAWTTTTTLLNGWTGTVNYIKRAGMVTVVFKLDSDGRTAANLLTLLSDYRPNTNIYEPVSNGTPSPVEVYPLSILTDGKININYSPNAPSDIRGHATYPVL